MNPITLYFNQPINDQTIMSLINFIENSKSDMKNLTININSAGGSLSAAITAYNYLKNLHVPVFMHNIGEVSSSALLLYLAGLTRTSEYIAKFMIHPISIMINQDLNYYRANEILDCIKSDIKNYSIIVNQETDKLKGKYDVEHFLKAESFYLDKQSAYECGIVTSL